MRQQRWIILVQMRCWVLKLSGYVKKLMWSCIQIQTKEHRYLFGTVLLTLFSICVVNPKIRISIFGHTSSQFRAPHIADSRNPKTVYTRWNVIAPIFSGFSDAIIVPKIKVIKRNFCISAIHLELHRVQRYRGRKIWKNWRDNVVWRDNVSSGAISISR